jgi:hypothetical protein
MLFSSCRYPPIMARQHSQPGTGGERANPAASSLNFPAAEQRLNPTRRREKIHAKVAAGAD